MEFRSAHPLSWCTFARPDTSHAHCPHNQRWPKVCLFFRGIGSSKDVLLFGEYICTFREKCVGRIWYKVTILAWSQLLARHYMLMSSIWPSDVPNNCCSPLRSDHRYYETKGMYTKLISIKYRSTEYIMLNDQTPEALNEWCCRAFSICQDVAEFTNAENDSLLVISLF